MHDAIPMSSLEIERIPILPVCSGGDFNASRNGAANILQASPSVILSRGATGIVLALKREGIGEGHEVLLPAFNCPSMVRAIQTAGATPQFYGIHEDLRYDIASVKRALSPLSRAILVPHFFGCIQDMMPIRDLCDEANLILLEDCAHVIAGADDSNGVGQVGDYVVASPRKFVPLSEGGLLAGKRMLSETSMGLPTSSSLRVLYDTIDIAIRAGRCGQLRWLMTVSKNARALVASSPADHSSRADEASSVATFERINVTGASALTRFLIERWDYSAAASARRQNYAQIAQTVDQSAGLSVLRSTLPLSSAPYMVPVLLQDVARQFGAMKARFPVWRWEESQRGVCKVTDHFAEHLVQIPCHQSLRPNELSHISRSIRDVAAIAR